MRHHIARHQLIAAPHFFSGGEVLRKPDQKAAKATTPFVQALDGINTVVRSAGAKRGVVDVRGGNIGIEIRMGVNYTEAVVRRGMALEDYVAVTSTNAAKLLGLYPRKGAIAIGSDADITIIDPALKKTLHISDLHVRDYSPWEGWEIEGWPTTVILRGKVMVDNGRLLGTPTDGQLIPRKIDPGVLRRPAF